MQTRTRSSRQPTKRCIEPRKPAGIACRHEAHRAVVSAPMPLRAGRVATLCCALFLAGRSAAGQSSTPLFYSSETLRLELQGDLRGLARDKGEKRVEHPALLRFANGAGRASVKVDLRTRGIF